MSSQEISRNASKRTIDLSSEDEECQRPAKKTKPAKQPNLNGQPTNLTLPANLHFEPKKAKSLRISSWNIVSLASASKKGFHSYVEAEDADILVLCETKVNVVPADPALNSRYPYQFWSISDKKGYAGTAILSKYEPISVTKTLPGHPNGELAGKGRIVILEFSKCYVIGTYVPNAGQGLKTLGEKKAWNKAFETHVRGLDAIKPVIWVGDLNVAPTEIDLINAKQNWNKSAGYTEAETSWYRDFLNPPLSISSTMSSAQGKLTATARDLAIETTAETVVAIVAPSPSSSANAKSATGVSLRTCTADLPNKFVDIWRERHPNLRHYTFFSFRHQARLKNNGWRLDMFVLSERLRGQVQMCEIRDEVWGASDHCPLVLDIDQEAIV